MSGDDRTPLSACPNPEREDSDPEENYSGRRVWIACSTCDTRSAFAVSRDSAGAAWNAAVAAWNAMWAGRAGEATKRVMAGIADHLEGRDDDDPEAHFAVWHRISEARAALEELGLSPPP